MAREKSTHPYRDHGAVPKCDGPRPSWLRRVHARAPLLVDLVLGCMLVTLAVLGFFTIGSITKVIGICPADFGSSFAGTAAFGFVATLVSLIVLGVLAHIGEGFFYASERGQRKS